MRDGLAVYSRVRVPASMKAHQLARDLGAQIFEAGAAGENVDGRSHPAWQWVMETTAVYPRD